MHCRIVKFKLQGNPSIRSKACIQFLYRCCLSWLTIEIFKPGLELNISQLKEINLEIKKLKNKEIWLTESTGIAFHITAGHSQQ